ncbi:gamma-glutamyltransferase family protein [Sphingomonas nostoxanthinifaciens]|uniref:gamma-glutamyltransferase family protein n=1 Tax=Sphingomonas nostoxanthinifaciens TaxID=2872652 RepID=UPI001CC1DAF4|nr:gamma-glutamyltransferase [Sphingomonas nostoxanthinifaciens]UAK25811.1 gamma-glutamyltransferase [Sphingomonas nostoxanthinifaciens]
MIHPARLLRRAASSLAIVALAAQPALAAEQGPKPAVHAKNAMVSAGNALVAQAMLDVLRKGGNAMDAGLTGVILQTVVEPQMVTLAGAMSLLYYDAKSKRYYYLDAELNHTRAGAPVSPGWVQVTLDPMPLPETSGRAIAVPGTVAGLKAAADRFGTLPWAHYFAPAIKTAEDGFPMYSFLYAELSDAAINRLSAYPSGRAEFLPSGFVPPVGAVMKRPNLARTMRRIAADGPDYFYKGEWAQHFVDGVRSAGGEMSLQDLADYRVRWEEPVHSSFRGYDIYGSPPPSTAGVLTAMILNIAEPWDLSPATHYAQDAASFYRIRRAFEFAEDFADGFVKDPVGYNVPLDTLLSKDFAHQLTRLIDGGMPKDATQVAVQRPTPAPAADGTNDPNSTDTDQLVAVDKDGNMLSLTHSVNGPTFGTGLVIDGVVTNGANYFPGRAIGDGLRTLSPFPPTIVAKGGAPVLTLGSPGLASRAVALMLVNYLGYGLTLEQSADAPRFQGSQYYRTATIESRVTDETRQRLAQHYGVTVRTTAPYNWHFGSVQAIARQSDGSLVGIADPRRPGVALGY